MLGLVFTEFVEMVEATHSHAVADAVLEAAGLPHGGAYTAVGYYPPEEFNRLLAALSRHTGEPPDHLAQTFGRHLASRFAQLHPGHFAPHHHPFDLLASVDSHIHVEVRKLYPDAQLPRFEVLSRGEGRMVLRYRSPRAMHHLAWGLIEGMAGHYGRPCRLEMALEDGGALFTITEVA